MDAEKVAIEAKEIERAFKKKGEDLFVLRGVDLRIATGEMVAIVGASGAGKSTLLHILGTLDRATRGEVFFFGKPVPFENDAALSMFRNRNIGFVFQFHHLLPEFSALENVMLPALISGEDRGTATRRAESILARVGLTSRLQHRPGELSGGEQQRVAIARAVVLAPRILIADEPTGNLDRENGRQIYDLLCELNHDLGVTLLLATHNLELASGMHRRFTMSDGKLD